MLTGSDADAKVPGTIDRARLLEVSGLGPDTSLALCRSIEGDVTGFEATA